MNDPYRSAGPQATENVADAGLIRQLEERALNDDVAATALHLLHAGMPLAELVERLIPMLLDERKRMMGIASLCMEHHAGPMRLTFPKGDKP